MELVEQLIARAKANKQRIVLPEGTEERTLKAANQILTDGVADLIILGNVDEIHELAKQWGLGNIDKATIIDPATSPKKEEYAELLAELRKKYPAMKFIFVSGYAEDAFARNLPADAKFGFLPKPFSLKQLAVAVREMLDGAN